MTYSDDNDTELSIEYHEREEVNAQACQLIEEEEHPYLLLTETQVDGKGNAIAVGLTMGNGINSLTEARRLCLMVLDQLDLVLLRMDD